MANSAGLGPGDAFDVLVYGDMADPNDFAGMKIPDGGDGLPLVEYPLTFNKNDGDDLIDVGDNNLRVGVFGQGGNDKIIGGWGTGQLDKLYGGTGDDKIWMVNPEQRHLDVGADATFNNGYGG